MKPPLEGASLQPEPDLVPNPRPDGRLGREQGPEGRGPDRLSGDRLRGHAATPASSDAGVGLKPPPDRLYGRQRSHALRPRQDLLLAVTLPRLRLRDPADPLGGFAERPEGLWLEVGFGGGEHALAQVAAHPGIGLIACEVFEQGLCSLMSRLVAEGGEADGALPPNLRVWDGDARVLLRLLPQGCLDRLFLMFPDPWPKSRHVKRRFVHPHLLPALARSMRRGATWHIATDDPTYQGWVAEVLAGQSWFTTPAPAMRRPDGWPATRYEAKALAAGRRPLYWTLTRTSRPVLAADDPGPATATDQATAGPETAGRLPTPQ